MYEIGFYVVLAISLITTAMFVIWHNNKKPLFSLMLKVMASLCFIILGVFSFYFSKNYTLGGIFVLLGLATSLIGDAVLALLEFKMEGKNDNIIICGMISFSLAQIFYFVALTLFSGGYLFWVSILASLVVAVAIVFGEKMLKLNYGKTKLFVGIYSFFLALSLMQSLMMAIKFGFNDFSLMMFLGMLSFFISDLILSFIYFNGKENRQLYYTNYGFYFMAQNLIAVALIYFVVV